MANMRFGGQSDILKPVITGQMNADDDQIRSASLYAAGFDGIFNGGPKYFMPIFADRSYSHQMRIYALEMAMWSKPSAADFVTIITTLFKEKDYEVTNYAFALMERWANTINPCYAQTSELAKFYLKYMKQYSKYETDFGFGVSKTYTREFYKKKYGYGGSYSFYVIGSHSSTTPTAFGMNIGQNMLGGHYNSFLIGLHMRVEGLAKALIRKFKTTDPAVWKTADLERILSGDMSIRERPDQPVKVAISLMVKGTVIFQRHYNEDDMKEGGKVRNEYFIYL